MLYGAAFTASLALFTGAKISFHAEAPYVFSLLYLSLFGSVIAFNLYLELLGNIGPDRAAYTVLIVPLIAMVFTTLFEGFVWHNSAIVGIVLLLLGNYLVLTKKIPFKNLSS
jgi:drug/metabolite transporter (DMT)-like permease